MFVPENYNTAKSNHKLKYNFSTVIVWYCFKSSVVFLTLLVFATTAAQNTPRDIFVAEGTQISGFNSIHLAHSNAKELYADATTIYLIKGSLISGSNQLRHATLIFESTSETQNYTSTIPKHKKPQLTVQKSVAKNINVISAPFGTGRTSFYFHENQSSVIANTSFECRNKTKAIMSLKLALLFYQQSSKSSQNNDFHKKHSTDGNHSLFFSRPPPIFVS